MDGRTIVETHFGVPNTSVPTPSQEMWSDRLMCLRKAIDDALEQAKAEEREKAAQLCERIGGSTGEMLAEALRE